MTTVTQTKANAGRTCDAPTVCKGCRRDLPRNKAGYCAECDAAIREDVEDGRREEQGMAANARLDGQKETL